MNQWRALVWKEAVETRWALYFSLLLMLLVMAMYQQEYQQFYWYFSILVYLGAAIALLVGVSSACRDRGEVEVFWRSRPIGTMRFTAVKYLCGLAVVLVSFGLVSSPVLVGGWRMAELSNREMASQFATLAAAAPLVIAACYSLSFLTGSLVHRPHQAVILALAATLLLLCLPMLLPPLRDVGFFYQLEARTITFSGGDSGNNLEVTRAYLMYALAMAAIIAATAAASAASFRRTWKIAMNQKLMAWLLGGLAVVMMATAAYQVGSNIEPVRVIELPGPSRQFAVAMAPGNGGRLLMLTGRGSQADGDLLMHLVDLDAEVPVASPPQLIVSAMPLYGIEVVWLERGGDSVAYVLGHASNDWDAGEILHVIDVARGRELTSFHFDTREAWIVGFEQDQLIVAFRDELVALNISQPSAPVVAETYTRQSLYRAAAPDDSRLVYGRPDVPALRRREDLMMRYVVGSLGGYGGEWPIYARMFDHQLHVFQITEAWAEGLVVELAGIRAATPLERFTFERSYAHNGAISDRMFFTLSRAASGNTMTVYDLHDPRRPRKFGHFVRPREWLTVLQPMPDGRMIAGGDKLYVFDVHRRAQ